MKQIQSCIQAIALGLLFGTLCNAAPAEQLRKRPVIPLTFESNAGQAPSEVRYVLHGRQQRLWLAPSRIVASIHGANRDVAIEWVGASPDVELVALGPSPTRSNYLIGNDRRKWLTNIPNHQRVVYRGLYPGVDLVFYGTETAFEYDLVVAPGADPSVIRMKIVGAQTALSSDGDLVLKAGAGEIVHRKPYSYQVEGRDRSSVDSRYVLHGRGEVSFALGAYDERKPLTIDPVWAYSKYFGGDVNSSAMAVAADGSGCMYVTGWTGEYSQRNSFPTTANSFQPSLPIGTIHAFVSKINAEGSAFVYSTYLGGSGEDFPNGIAVDSAGNAYVTGYTESHNFPVTTGAFQTVFSGTSSNAFVTKLAPAGDRLVYSTFLGADGGNTRANAITIDSAGNAYVAGQTSAPSFPTTVGVVQPSHAGNIDAFIAKLNPAGNALVYSTLLGNTGQTKALGLTTDAAGNVFVTGTTTWESGFPVTSGAYRPGGSFRPEGAFLTKLNSTATELVYSTLLATGTSGGTGVAVDPSGNAYVVGYVARGAMTPTAGAFRTDYDATASPESPQSLIFAIKVNPAGSSLLYCTYVGISHTDGYADGHSGIFVDGLGRAYLAGETQSYNFPTTPDAYEKTNSGLHTYGTPTAGYFTVLNPAGSALLYSTYWLPVRGFAIDAKGYVYLAGYVEVYFGYLATTIAKVEPLFAPALSIAKTHTGSFFKGGKNATYTVMVSNTGVSPTAGSVTVSETIPAGLTLVSMAGTGWTCPPAGTTCTRADALSPGSSYPAITVTVDVSTDAAAQVTNQVGVTGGGSASASASDPTFIRSVTGGGGSTAAGVFRAGQWIVDRNGDGLWNGAPPDLLMYLGQAGDTYLVGDWNGDGRAKAGIFRAGLWVLDYNGNGVWDGPSVDRFFYLGQAGDRAVVGDWNGDGRAKAGVFRNGQWILDINGNGVWDGPSVDRVMYLGETGDTPLVGDWNGDGRAKAGIFRGGLWVLDYNGNGVWDGPSIDRFFYLGQTGDTALVGDWNGDGRVKAGIFRDGLWVLDYNGSGQWDGPSVDRFFYLGQGGDAALVGDWNGDGRAKGGIFRGGLWVLDKNGNGVWDGMPTDTFFYLGQAGDSPAVGKWQ